MSCGIGVSVLRSEDIRHLQGRGEFLADITLPGLQDVAFLRSPVAHARIRGIEPAAGSERRVFTAADFENIKPIRAVAGAAGFKASDYPALAVDKVRFVGEPVAMCLAATRAQAEDLAQDVFLDLAELPAVVDMEAALVAGAPRVHDHWPDNLVLEQSIEGGNVAAAKAAATHTVTRH
ncbi:MAG: xanthine dehydrogenase family protein molybdopterin-binding subunit, partial [Kiloniellales bacterium]